MPDKGTVDTVFFLRRLQYEYCAKGKKLYVCFVDLKKTVTECRENVGMGNEEVYQKFWLDQ